MNTSNILLQKLSIQTCRICLQNYETLHSLYDEVLYGDKQRMTLRDILLCVTNVQIATDLETSPTKLCQECTDKLLSAFEFIRATEKSEQLLRDCLKFDIKEEEEETEVEVPAIEVTEDENKYMEVLDDEYQTVWIEEVEEDEHDQQVQTSTTLEKELMMNSSTNIAVEQFSVHNEQSTAEAPLMVIAKVETKVEADNYWEEFEQHKNRRIRRIQIGSRLRNDEPPNWHKCDRCQRAFAKKETLQRHIKTAHTFCSPERLASLATPKSKCNNETAIKCPHCPREFARKDCLHRHLLATHPDQVDVTTIDEDDAGNAKKKHNYKYGLCPYCGQSFVHSSLVIHIRRHTGEKPYQCSECDKGFPRRQDLIIHQRQHSGEKPHICTVCGKSFIRPNKLSRHMRIHTGQRPYKCTECNKSFSQSNDLKIHVRRHTGEKPYKCGVCSESFISSTALKTHRKTRAHYLPDDYVATDPYASCRVNARAKQLKPPTIDLKVDS